MLRISPAEVFFAQEFEYQILYQLSMSMRLILCLPQGLWSRGHTTLDFVITHVNRNKDMFQTCFNMHSAEELQLAVTAHKSRLGIHTYLPHACSTGSHQHTDANCCYSSICAYVSVRPSAMPTSAENLEKSFNSNHVPPPPTPFLHDEQGPLHSPRTDGQNRCHRWNNSELYYLICQGNDP